MADGRVVSGVLAVLCVGVSAFGQSELEVRPVEDPEPPAWLIDESLNPERGEAEREGRRAELARAEKELKRIRWKYIRNVRNAELRQVGISKIREYDDPALYPSLFEIFEREGKDVLIAILDMLEEGANEEADAALAWASVFQKDEAIRAEAEKRLADRVEALGQVPTRVQSVIAMGLRGTGHEAAGEAAELADEFDLVQAIPAMINAQISGTTAQVGSSGRQGDGALGYILVAQQVSFVSDLTPIVGESAVGFDPTVSVVSEGVVMEVFDAHVVTYRTIVNNALINLTSRHYGRSTEGLAWDRQAWQNWYEREFLPRWNAGTLPLASDDPTPAPVTANVVEEPHVVTGESGSVIDEPAGAVRPCRSGRPRHDPASGGGQ